LVAVARAGHRPWAPNVIHAQNSVDPYGVLDTIKTTVEDLLESGVAIKDRVETIIEQVTEIVSELKDFYEKASEKKEDAIDAILEKIRNHLVKEISKILEHVFDEIARVFLGVAEKVDDMIRGIWGEAQLRDAIQNLMNTIFEDYINVILDALRGILEGIDYIQNDLIDDVLDSMEAKLQDKLDAFGDLLKEKLNKNSKTASKRDSPEDHLQSLLHEQNPVNHVDESGCAASFGLTDNLKNVLLGTQDTLLWTKEKFVEFEEKMELLMKSIRGVRGDKKSNKWLKFVQDRIQEIVLDFIDAITSVVKSGIQSIIDAVDEFISDRLCPIKEKIYQWIDDVILSTIENIMSVIQKILNRLNNIEGGDWNGIIDHVLDMVEEKLNNIFEDLRQRIKDKIAKLSG